MSLFSERNGYKKIKEVIQINNIDIDLKIGLWNVFTELLWDNLDKMEIYHYENKFLKVLWKDYFKEPIDTLGTSSDKIYKKIKNYFFSCQWYEIYDFIEFISRISYYNSENLLTREFNKALEKERSSYRFVGGHIIKITSNVEINQINEALHSPLQSINKHLDSALSLISDRQNPDFRNSIKESISAVESICKKITNNQKATLGDALKLIEKNKHVELHSALKSAFEKLYGYTNDSDGIRHALLEESTLDYEDAVFMLITCSAFINYLTVKASKSNIKL